MITRGDSEYPYVAFIRSDEIHEQFDAGALARTVGADEAKSFPFIHGKGEIDKGDMGWCGNFFGIDLGNVLKGDHFFPLL